MRRLVLGLVPILALPLAACSGTNNLMSPPDMASGAPVDMTVGPDLALPERAPTDHPPLTQVNNYGGAVLKSAEIWTVVWQGDEALGQQVQEFLSWMMTSDYYVNSLSEYGVGPGKAMGVIVLPEAPPATLDDSAVSPLIKNYLAANPSFPLDANTLISFIVPKNTQSTLQGGQGCRDYGGYHAETRKATGSNTYVPYAINLQCQGFGGNTPFDNLTEVLSHEVAEAATDAHPYTDPAWSADYTVAPLGGEIGDLCVGLSTTFNVTVDVPDAGTADESYYVTRLYSNQAAIAGNTDPCVPAPSTPYFNVGVNPTNIMVTNTTSGVSTDALLEPYAFGDVGVIKWALEGQPGTGITITPDSGSAMAGDTIRIKIDVAGNVQSGPYPVLIYTESAHGGVNQWMSALNVN